MSDVCDPPLVAGPLCGLRAWAVESTSAGDRLAGPYAQTPWPTDRALNAECSRSGHAAPHGGCSCGVYAWHPSSDSAATVCRDANIEDGTVAGIVAAWGEVEVHADGFRAACGRPHTLLIPRHTAPEQAARIRRLAQTYGAATLIAGPKGLLQHCGAQGLGLDAHATTELLGPVHVQAQRRQRRSRGVRVAAVGLGVVTSIALLVAAVSLWPSVSGALQADPVVIAPEVRALRIVGEYVVDDQDGSSAYIAVVRNEHPTKTALGVFTAGTLYQRDGLLLGRLENRLDFELRPVLAPGETAVTVDVLDNAGTLEAKARRYHTTALARAFRTAPGGARVRITDATVDRRRCLVQATVTSDRARLSASVSILAFRTRHRLDWAQLADVGPLPAGRSRQVLLRITPPHCRRRIAAVDVYPNLSYGQAIPRR